MDFSCWFSMPISVSSVPPWFICGFHVEHPTPDLL